MLAIAQQLQRVPLQAVLHGLVISTNQGAPNDVFDVNCLDAELLGIDTKCCFMSLTV